jgi:hypothetical protein
MIDIDSTHIALSALQSDGAEKGIGIWDTKYGTLLAWKMYPENSETHQVCAIFISSYLRRDKGGTFSFTFFIGKNPNAPKNLNGQNLLTTVHWEACS